MKKVGKPTYSKILNEFKSVFRTLIARSAGTYETCVFYYVSCVQEDEDQKTLASGPLDGDFVVEKIARVCYVNGVCLRRICWFPRPCWNVFLSEIRCESRAQPRAVDNPISRLYEKLIVM